MRFRLGPNSSKPNQSQSKPDQEKGLGFSWIPSSNSRLFNGLRAIQSKKKFFSRPLLPGGHGVFRSTGCEWRRRVERLTTRRSPRGRRENRYRTSSQPRQEISLWRRGGAAIFHARTDRRRALRRGRRRRPRRPLVVEALMPGWVGRQTAGIDPLLPFPVRKECARSDRSGSKLRTRPFDPNRTSGNPLTPASVPSAF